MTVSTALYVEFFAFGTSAGRCPLGALLTRGVSAVRPLFVEAVRAQRSYAASDVDFVIVGYLARSDAPGPLSRSPAFAVCDAAANSSTFARIGPNGPYLCCSRSIERLSPAIEAMVHNIATNKKSRERFIVHSA